MVTIKDIAKKAGVSVGTVSKALNDKHDVSIELKQKIKEMAEEMNFFPNQIAKKLIEKKSRTIGVFFLSRKIIKLEENYGIKFLDGILEELEEREYDVSLFSITYERGFDKSYIKMCRERMVEGAIFIGFGLLDPHIKELKKADFPIVFTDLFTEGEKIAGVGSDNEEGIKKGMEYLYKKGHRKIVFIGGDTTSEVSIIRTNAYIDYMTEKKLEENIKIYYGNFTRESGYKAGKNIVRDRNCTAVFSASDIMALGALKAMREEGVKIPEDISIMGFDNIIYSEYSEPPLTTVSQKAIEIGREVVKTIFKMIEKKEFEKKVLLSTELVERQSVKEIDKNSF